MSRFLCYAKLLQIICLAQSPKDGKGDYKTRASKDAWWLEDKIKDKKMKTPTAYDQHEI